MAMEPFLRSPTLQIQNGPVLLAGFVDCRTQTARSCLCAIDTKLQKLQDALPIARNRFEFN